VRTAHVMLYAISSQV